ncbi:MAG TPA: hypothetical protein VM869_02635, partial [Enhygromyxa sp.]|nr:hypothetical protein [Enhygromyxa sp.]
AEYEELTATLEDDRTQALDDAVTDITTAGPWLAWLDGQTLGLRRYPDRLELELAAPDPSYRLGATHVITAERSDLALLYRAHALPGGELIDEQSFTAPEAALLGDEAVVIESESDDQAQAIWRWRIGVEAPTQLGTLADVGIVGERVEQLEAVQRGPEPLLILRADGRLWSLALTSLTATAIADVDALLAVDSRSVLYTHEGGLHLHALETGETVRIDAAIAESGWTLNPTFSNIHLYAGDGATLADDRVLYIASAGVFAYAIDQLGPEAITPILLEPRWDVAAEIPRVEYREPRFAGGTVFARGLIGPSGEVGEQGPIFAVPE